MTRFARERRDYIEEVAGPDRRRGPFSASEIGERGERRGSWWHGTTAMGGGIPVLAGRVAALSRSNSFERAYDLRSGCCASRAGAADAARARRPSRADAHRRHRARLATAKDLRDYSAWRARDGRGRSTRSSRGRSRSADFEGWRHPPYLDAHAASRAGSRRGPLLAPSIR